MVQKRKVTKIPVLFRKWPRLKGGGIIAIFPTELGTDDPHTSSMYEHVGQHGAGDTRDVVQRTKRATPSEYASLLKELHKIGYRGLVVVQKLQQSFLAERRRKLAKMR
ncbi:hypothetical protein LCGC14_2967330 [marine sediment metagenome]|uniref:Uncharacterized protein n=1 Tax=marine sediment metagenome TaxID=412755 RepID=A0A0F8XBD0_9ZZZZ